MTILEALEQSAELALAVDRKPSIAMVPADLHDLMVRYGMRRGMLMWIDHREALQRQRAQ